MNDLPDLPLLLRLLSMDSPSGDEARMTDFLERYVALESTLGGTVGVTRLRDNLIIARGAKPRVAIFAHCDTTGFTAGYGRAMIPIGSPEPEDGDSVRVIGTGADGAVGRLRRNGDDEFVLEGFAAEPGSRLVYAAEPKVGDGKIVSPYLDNRAGIWAALRTLAECESVVVCFTAGEEVSGSGAAICARHIFDRYAIAESIVCDLTWDTDWVHCGSGVAISRRDSSVPRQSYVDRIVDLARSGTVPFQIEVESSGGSDGVGIERSGRPIDWVFVGAPQKRPHTATEELFFSDLAGMANMIAALVDGLT